MCFWFQIRILGLCKGFGQLSPAGQALTKSVRFRGFSRKNPHSVQQLESLKKQFKL